jgi:hypothetical protein
MFIIGISGREPEQLPVSRATKEQEEVRNRQREAGPLTLCAAYQAPTGLPTLCSTSRTFRTSMPGIRFDREAGPRQRRALELHLSLLKTSSDGAVSRSLTGLAPDSRRSVHRSGAGSVIPRGERCAWLTAVLTVGLAAVLMGLVWYGLCYCTEALSGGSAPSQAGAGHGLS